MVETLHEDGRLAESLATSGLRFTRQRQQVFSVVAESHDHPSAEEIYTRTRTRMPDISFATVYNCLGVLVQCGLVRQVLLDRGHARYCPNMRDHCHFFCERCGHVTDVDLPRHKAIIPLPPGYEPTNFDLSVRGLCRSCANTPPSPA
jgi:Fe2+ or Zn2+ uptake regulation protein